MRRKDMTLRAVTHLTCRCCGRTLPVTLFERYPTGTYRHVCNDCKYMNYTLPAQQRRKEKARFLPPGVFK